MTVFMDLNAPGQAYVLGLFQTDVHLSQGVGAKGTLALELAERAAVILTDLQRHRLSHPDRAWT